MCHCLASSPFLQPGVCRVFEELNLAKTGKIWLSMAELLCSKIHSLPLSCTLLLPLHES